jgi:hypothetical protein
MNNGITAMFEYVSLEILDGVSKEKRKALLGGTITPGYRQA